MPKYLGSWGRLERLGCSPYDRRQGLELHCNSGRPVFSRGKRHQVGCGGLVWVRWLNTLSASRQMARFLYFQWKIFQLQFFFLFINIFLRSFFIFWIKGNHPWHNKGWMLPWKSQFPLNAPCSFSRHFPKKGSGISAAPACAPDKFYLGSFMFLPVSACLVFFFTVSLIQHPLKRMDIFLVTLSRLTELYSPQRGGTGSLPLLVMITAIIFTLPGFCLSWLAGYRTSYPASQGVYNPLSEYSS